MWKRNGYDRDDIERGFPWGNITNLVFGKLVWLLFQIWIDLSTYLMDDTNSH